MEKATRKTQRAQTKASLLATAYEVFSERGFISTRMSDIAEAAGVSHGTVFLHFVSQEALITQVVDVYCGKIAQRTHELADSGASLREILSAHLDGIMEFEPFYTRLAIESRLLPTGARDSWINLQSAISYHFSQALERELASPVSPAVLFNMWMGLTQYYLCNGDIFAPEGKVVERYGATMIESYLALVEPKSGNA